MRVASRRAQPFVSCTHPPAWTHKATRQATSTASSASTAPRSSRLPGTPPPPRGERSRVPAEDYLSQDLVVLVRGFLVQPLATGWWCSATVWCMAFTLRLPAKLEGALNGYCAASRVPKSAVVELALEAYLWPVDRDGTRAPLAGEDAAGGHNVQAGSSPAIGELDGRLAAAVLVPDATLPAELEAVLAASPVPVVRGSELGGKVFRGPDPRGGK